MFKIQNNGDVWNQHAYYLLGNPHLRRENVTPKRDFESGLFLGVACLRLEYDQNEEQKVKEK